MATAFWTEAELTDVRSFCGFPAVGSGPTNDPFGRYYVSYVQDEFRIRNLTDAEMVKARAKLVQLRALDTGIVASADNLDTAQASVWVHNANEVRDRSALFAQRRRDLCDFLGVGPGPGLRSANSARLIV